MLALDKIRLDGGTQSRAELSEETIAEYAECVADLPPVDVFVDEEETHWLADGFHRHAAFVRAGRKKILCVLHDGDVHDARKFSAGCNAAHGNRRNREDVRAAILMLVRDEKWKEKSDNWVATSVGCDPKTVAKARSDFGISKVKVRETSSGRKVDTTKMGRPKRTEPKSSPRATTKDNVTADDVAAARARKEELDARDVAAKAPVPEKWECPDCHTWWAADVDICRECAPENDGEETEDDDAPSSEERAQDDRAADERERDADSALIDLDEDIERHLRNWEWGSTRFIAALEGWARRARAHFASKENSQ